MRTCTCIYHFLVLNWYIFLNYYIPRHGNEQKEYKIFQDGAQWKYLTLLNLFLQAFFFGVACLDDVLKRIKGRRNIRFITAFRDLLFTTLAFPVSTFVFLVFWTIFLYDRELVHPKILDEIFPIWMNHAMVSEGTSSDRGRSVTCALNTPKCLFMSFSQPPTSNRSSLPTLSLEVMR
ncbi:Hypothetical predicted protein [Marmota monax]|uniref:Androgen-dependent TFPI-regulating protein n=1 Tax=Marmota monax TaxID=9995 RepID=A0A5E4A8B4_MARMO|nr:androgen-dependent TFPI-regulating protein [Marmota monax]VTJ53378.1 Hypothetical predicted protein [Marmota monax]